MTAPRDPPSLLATVQALLNDLRVAASVRFQLLSLELQLAGWTLAQLLFCAVVAAFLAGTTWLIIMASIAVAFIERGTPWPILAATAAGINLALMLIVVKAGQSLLPRLSLSATVRAMATPGASPGVSESVNQHVS